MKRLIYFFAFVAVLLLAVSCSPRERHIKVMQFNIWQEGTVVPGGFNGIADQIAAANPDFVTLSEVRNYKNTRFCDRITKALKDKGLTYHSFYSYDSGLLSKYPIIDSTVVSPCVNDHGSVYRALIDMKGTKVALYTAHLDYLRDTYYDVRGYNGSSWKERTPMVQVDSILADNILSQRDDEIKLFLSKAAADKAKGYIVMLGGDFNEPSLYDWVEATKNMYDHHGTVVPWTVTKLLADSGYVDSYRKFFPNPLTHPGFTFPAANRTQNPMKLTWAPKSDERERVDYIFFAPHKGLSVIDATIWGPNGMVCKGKFATDSLRDPVHIGKGVWPTDHRAVLVTLKLVKK